MIRHIKMTQPLPMRIRPPRPHKNRPRPRPHPQINLKSLPHPHRNPHHIQPIPPSTLRHKLIHLGKRMRRRHKTRGNLGLRGGVRGMLEDVDVQDEEDETVFPAVEGEGQGGEGVSCEGGADNGEGLLGFGLGGLADGVGGFGGEEEVNSMDEVGVRGGGGI